MTFAYRVLALLLRRPVFGLVFGLRASGLEHIPPGGFVLCANQLSNLDSLALASPIYPRPLRSMAKAELFNPVLVSGRSRSTTSSDAGRRSSCAVWRVPRSERTWPRCSGCL